MEIIKKIALILVIIGALNWLLVGLFEMDLVATIFGASTNIIAKIHNFKLKLFFDGKDMEDEIIDDFKV